jgi:hypothetical protein
VQPSVPLSNGGKERDRRKKRYEGKCEELRERDENV